MHISLKMKITIWYTLVMIVTASIVLTAMISISKDTIDSDIKMRIKRVVDENARRVLMPMLPKSSGIPQKPFHFYDDGVHMVLYDSNGNVLDGHLPFETDDEPVFLHTLTEKNYDGNKYYVYDREVFSHKDHEKYWLRGVISVTDESYALAALTKNNIIITVILIFIAAIGGYFIVSRAFVPVNKISKTAKEISESSDLSRRINIGKGKDEISELANTFDVMLEKLEKTFESEKQFTSDASHELRTPVAVILSECEYMDECAKTDDEYKESVNAIKRQANKMSKLISELLMITKMDKNSIKLNIEETDLSELLSFVCDEQEEIRSTGVVLVRNIKKNIVAHVDKSLMARTFINLISNAYQYSNETGKIYVTLEEKEDKILFSVKDEGKGISKENLPKIWERFYQVEQSRKSSENGSMGLGLSMVKWIVDAHNGEISVESELEKGSNFIIKISNKRL